MEDWHHIFKHTLDILSFGAVLSTLLGFLPPIAALMSIVWLGWQMFDRLKYGSVHEHHRKEDK